MNLRWMPSLLFDRRWETNVLALKRAFWGAVRTLSLQQRSDESFRTGVDTEYTSLAIDFPIKSAAATLSLLSLRLQLPNESKMDVVQEMGGSGRKGMLIGWNVSADCEVQGQSLLNDRGWT